MSIPHSTAPIQAAQAALVHAIAGAKAAQIGAVNAIHVAISHTVSHALVHPLFALYSLHKRGVLMSVCSLQLKAVHSSNSFCLCAAKALTSSSQNISIALSCTHFSRADHSNCSAPHFQSLSIRCPIML